jgi:hypothetical protein
VRLRLEALEDRCVPSASTVADAYGRLPLAFEANQGQVDSQVNFLSHGRGYSLFLMPTQAVVNLQSSTGSDQGTTDSTLTMQLIGSNPAATPVGVDQTASVSNYLLGADPREWHTNVPNYARVAYQNVYPGINLVYYGNNQQHPEYDFMLAPGADPNTIRMSFQGAQGMSLDAQGNLVLKTSGGDVVEQAPVVYQTINGARQPIAGRYVLESNGQVGFGVGAYDGAEPLVIDPTYSIVYSTYLGGSGGVLGNTVAIAVDNSGNAYVTGSTNGGFPTQNALQNRYRGNGDAFVTKLNAAGTGLVYSTYLGGKSGDGGAGIAVDGSGNAYVDGTTGSTDFPTTAGAYSTSLSTGGLFLAELNSTGTQLLYSSYIGGVGSNQQGVALDSSGNAYVTGGTTLAMKINPLLSGTASLVYSFDIGGTGRGRAIAVDGAGDGYVTGTVQSANFPTTPGAYQTTYTHVEEPFVAELNPAGNALVYSTFIVNGSYTNNTHGIAVNSAGDAYVTGSTDAPDFPTVNAFQSTTVGQSAFITEFNGTGSGLLYSTYLGGSSLGDEGLAIAVDGAGHAYVTGDTNSTTFPTVNAFQSTYAGGTDAFVAEFDPSQSGAASVVYSSYPGTSNEDKGTGIAVDSGGNAYVTGRTFTNFPTTPGAFQTTYPGNAKNTPQEAFVTKIDPPVDAAVVGPDGGEAAVPAAASHATAVTIVPYSVGVSALPASLLTALLDQAATGATAVTATARGSGATLRGFGMPLIVALPIRETHAAVMDGAGAEDADMTALDRVWAEFTDGWPAFCEQTPEG